VSRHRQRAQRRRRSRAPCRAIRDRSRHPGLLRAPAPGDGSPLGGGDSSPMTHTRSRNRSATSTAWSRESPRCSRGPDRVGRHRTRPGTGIDRRDTAAHHRSCTAGSVRPHAPGDPHGNRGVITSARIDAVKADAATGLGWITALRAPAIAKLARDDGHPSATAVPSLRRSRDAVHLHPGRAFTFTISNPSQYQPTMHSPVYPASRLSVTYLVARAAL
jgi:hypothetical protein